MIALDTGFLIYGTQAGRFRPQLGQYPRGGFSPVELARVPPAVEILNQFRASGQTVVIPAPAAWEYVLDFEVEQQAKIWRSISMFTVLPFDAAAARVASEISRRYSDRIQSSAKGTGKREATAVGARQQMKVDIQIVAIAIAQRAEAIYTLEVEKFSEWAAGAIAVVGLPRKLTA